MFKAHAGPQSEGAKRAKLLRPKILKDSVDSNGFCFCFSLYIEVNVK